jgi:hypothetical protein
MLDPHLGARGKPEAVLFDWRFDRAGNRAVGPGLYLTKGVLI